MLTAALRDLQWRYKRVAITVLGTALVFAMSLLMSGLSNSFTVEVERSLNDQAADYWIAPASNPGPFAGSVNIGPTQTAAIAAIPGVVRADPFLLARATTKVGGIVQQMNLLGVVPGGLGSAAKAQSGSPTPKAGTVVVPAKLGLKLGETLTLSGETFTVSGVVAKASLYAGQSTISLSLKDAQRVALGGLDRASFVLVSIDPKLRSSNTGPGDQGEQGDQGVRSGGSPQLLKAELPQGLAAFGRTDARNDLLRPLKSATQSIGFIKFLLWGVAGLIVGSVVYLTTLERTKDVAVFKATGVSTSSIGAGVCLQAVILAVIASVIGVGLALVLAPNFPMDVDVSTSSLLSLPLLAVFVGLLAGLIGVRKTSHVEPAAAFGGP